jgi:anti-sigma regulatory factor (Ser/Thr protein kinase)
MQQRWQYPSTRASVPAARHALRAALTGWGLGEEVDTAELCAAELVTNAVIHARRPPGREVALSVALSAAGLRIEVEDADGAPPEPRVAVPDDASGRGLMLLDALAAEWGSLPRPCGVGKIVWCLIKVPSGARP